MKKKEKNNHKGVSPVIATVLLIAIVVIIGLIIFMWFRGIAQEAVTKFGSNIELACNEVGFDASYSAGTLSISNIGNIPIFGIKIKIIGERSFETKDIKDLSGNWPAQGINQGGAFSDSIDFVGSVSEIILIPVLIGESDNGKKTFVCDENQFGYELLIS